MAKAMLAVNVFGGAGIAFALFWVYSDRSWPAAFWWMVLYAAAFAFPLHLSRRARRQLEALGDVPRRVRQITFYPVWAAYVVLLAALVLIRHITGR